MVLLFVLLVANQKQKSQAQSAVAKHSARLLVETRRVLLGTRRVLFCCVWVFCFLVRLATTTTTGHNHLFYHGGSALSLALPENDEVALLQRELVSDLLLRMLPRPEAIK